MKTIGKGEMTVEYNGEILGTTSIDIVDNGKDAIIDFVMIPSTQINGIFIPIDLVDNDIIIEGREIHFLENKE